MIRLGYSFWGFLGPGIRDTPDGGRSHRLTLVEGLAKDGYDLLFLQRDRDLTEAGDRRYRHVGRWHEQGFPPLDALFLEWRWEIPGRNTPNDRGKLGYTPDLTRQTDLVRHYILGLNTPTIVWDKDQQLPPQHFLWARKNVRVAQPTRFPKSPASTLLFPVPDDYLSSWPRPRLHKRSLKLVYIGNQYNRDDAFDEFFAKPALELDHAVYGKWTNTEAWPWVVFCNRIPYSQVAARYESSLATVLLAPSRYRSSGQITQRIFESLRQACLAIGTSDTLSIDEIVPKSLIAQDGMDVLRIVQWLAGIENTDTHQQLIAVARKQLAVFRLSAQLRTVHELLSDIDPSLIRPP